MRIAQVSPLYESVPPKYYGGTERVVSYLTEELVRQGHDVTLYASGDSRTAARLVPGAPEALRLNARATDPLAYHIRMLELVLRDQRAFDVVHYHIDYLHFPLSRRQPVPSLTTLHGRLNIPDLVPLYEEFRDTPLVSISDAQRQPLSWANWQATVYHGLPPGLLQPGDGSDDYLAFVGRISPEKRVDRAIEIARQSGVPLRIAAKVDAADREYFEREIEPLLGTPGVRFVGEISETEKGPFLAAARALIFPIDWPEPFGLAMIEAMACGTPVIAWRHGSIPEVIDPGVTGFIVDSIDEAVRAVATVTSLDRRACRRRFEERFTAARMAHDYVVIYERLVSGRRITVPAAA